MGHIRPSTGGLQEDVLLTLEEVGRTHPDQGAGGGSVTLESRDTFFVCPTPTILKGQLEKGITQFALVYFKVSQTASPTQ